MKKFVYTVQNAFGLHVRPAGLIAKQAQEYPNTVITITCGPETVSATSTMKLMSLGVKKGDVVTLVCDGEHEDNAIEAVGEVITEVL